MTANSLTRTAAARPFAIVSGAFGLAAGVCFVFFLAYGDPAGFASDVLGWVQLVALAPVALALPGRICRPHRPRASPAPSSPRPPF